MKSFIPPDGTRSPEMRRRSSLEPGGENLKAIYHNTPPIEIPPSTVMIRGIGWDSNIYLYLDGREALIVDSGTGTNWQVYAGLLRDYLTGVRRVVLFNTHEHFDHVGGDAAMMGWIEKEGVEVLLAAHEATARAIERGDDGVILSYYYGRRFEPLQVDVRLKDDDRLRVGSTDLLIIHTPGHTAGSSCLYLDGETKIMFTGDTLFRDAAGRTDLLTGDERELRESLRRLLEFNVDFGLPGHGSYIDDWKRNLRKVLKGITGSG